MIRLIGDRELDMYVAEFLSGATCRIDDVDVDVEGYVTDGPGGFVEIVGREWRTDAEGERVDDVPFRKSMLDIEEIEVY